MEHESLNAGLLAPRSSPLASMLFVVCLFVCPLLFFTDLTRNPYFTQIALLNIALLGVLAAYAVAHFSKDVWVLPRTPLDVPLGCWILVCALSWTWSYFHHGAFYRDAMRAEGLRVFAFTLINTILPFYAAALLVKETPRESCIPVASWAIFAVVWGFLWMLFPYMRSIGGAPLDTWSHVWDSYGGLVWLAGLIAAGYLIWGGTAHQYWHLALVVGFLSSIYGIAQYFNTECIWPKVLNPYGGRAVSTFGNPNFMSSYLVLLMPMAVAYYLQAKTLAARLVYVGVFFAMEGCLVTSLTRSSWVGAVVALGVLFFSKELRKAARENLELNGLVATLAVLLVLLWPQSTVKGYTPSVLGRVQELSSMLDTKTATPYSPLYQRALIWTCAWIMGKQNPLLGNGWGLFELFYPFYQGHVLLHFDLFHTMRTHANNAHNEIMEVWSQVGILGVGVLFWIWTVFFVSAGRWIRDSAEKSEIWLIAPLAGVAGMLVDNLLNVSLHFAVPAFLFWWQSGCIMGYAANVERRWRAFRFSRRWLSVGSSVLVIAICLQGGWWWIRQWNREVCYFTGFKLMRGGSLSASVQMLENAYRWHSREVNTDYELGNSYARSGLFPKAVWAYREALKSNAGYDEIYFNLGTVLFQKMGRPEEALNDYLVSFLINPLSMELYVNLSALYLQNPERYREQAIELLEHATRIFPSQPAFFNNLGYLYGLGREYRKAEDAWVQALRLDPDQISVERNLEALVRQAHRPLPAAVADLAKLRSLESRIGRRDYSAETLTLARSVAEQFPQSIKARFYLGNLELLNGHPEIALSLLEPLLRIDPKNISLQQNLGEAYFRLGRKQEAINAFRSVLELDQGNKYARQRLSQIGE